MKLIALNFAALLAYASVLFGQQTTAPSGNYQVAYLNLSGPIKDKDDAKFESKLILGLRDGKVVSTWVPLDITVPDGSGVTFDGGALRGNVVDRQTGLPPASLFTYTLDAQVAGGKISGTFQSKFKDGVRERLASGDITGELKSIADLARQNAFDSAAAWSCYRGPNGNFTSPANTVPLVESLAEARHVWKGEEEQPGSPGRTGGLTRKLMGVPTTRISGGGSSPVVGEGKVIVSFFVPSGKVYDQRAVTELTAKYGPEFTNREKVLVGADDVVLCLDATTGQTLWKTVFAGKGLNWQEHKSSPNNCAPLIHEGKAYAIGSTLRLYCLELTSGNVIWESNLGPRHEIIEKAKQKGLETQSYQGANLGSRHSGGAPIIAGGVLVVNDMAADICGFDLATGKELWRVKGVNDPNSPPARWTHSGRELSLASNKDGITCIDPRDGNVLWKLTTPVGGSDCLINTADDYCVFFAPPAGEVAPGGEAGEEGAGELLCYRLSPSEPTKLWSQPAQVHSPYAVPHLIGGHAYISGREQTDCFELATGKLVSTAKGPGAGNAGHMFSAGERLFISQDGKHGSVRLVTLNASPKDFRHTYAEGWTPPHANTTAYGHTPMTFPIVDGRLYIRGADAVYCYDLRQSAK